MALGPTQPPIQWIPGPLSLGVKRLGRGAVPPLPQYVFMAWCLVKHRDNFTFTFYRLEDRGVRVPAGAGNFSPTTASRLALGPTQHPIQWVPGALSLGVEQPGRETDHSPPSSVEVKNEWSYASTPQYTFMSWCSD
jgi:hypothetical protein